MTAADPTPASVRSTEDPAVTLSCRCDTVVLTTDDVCNEVAKVKITVDGRRTTDDDDEVVPSQPHSGAILNTTFTVGAQQHTANNAPTNDECVTVSGETEVSDPATPRVTTTTTTSSAQPSPWSRPRCRTADHTCVYNAGAVVIPPASKPRRGYSEGQQGPAMSWATPWARSSSPTMATIARRRSRRRHRRRLDADHGR